MESIGYGKHEKWGAWRMREARTNTDGAYESGHSFNCKRGEPGKASAYVGGQKLRIGRLGRWQVGERGPCWTKNHGEPLQEDWRKTRPQTLVLELRVQMQPGKQADGTKKHREGSTAVCHPQGFPVRAVSPAIVPENHALSV